MLIGALIGVLCWQRKGLNLGLAVIGGILLGPLAFLMLFASPGGSGTRKCPHCASWISREARVCPRCQRDVIAPAAIGPSYGHGMKR
jgi:hypothetical protein